MGESEAAGRAWRGPEIIALVRGGSEEAVLTACKVSPYSGPHLDYTTCMDPECVGCAGYVDS